MRKVSVGLVADVAEFIRNVTGAKKSVDDLGDEVKQLDHELDKIPADAAKAAAALKLLNGDVESVGKHVDDLGAKTSLAALDSKIRTTRSEVKKLADEFVETGDVDVFKKLGDAQGRLGSLMKIRKSVAESIKSGAEDAAESPGLLEIAQKIGMGLAAGMAIPLLAALGGAITGATGFGVAGLGLLGAALGDPQRFGFAWSQTLQNLRAQFINASDPFRNELFNVIAGIGPLVRSWHIDEILQNAAKYVQPLVRGLEGFAGHIVAGVGTLVEKGGPAVDALSQSMDRLGLASERAMNSISDGAQGGAYALHDTANAVSIVIEGFGLLIEQAERFYAFSRDHPVQAGFLTLGLSTPLTLFSHTVGEADGLTRQLTTTQLGLQQAAVAAGHAFNAQGDDLSALSQQLNATTLSTDTLAASMVNKLFTATMNLDQATLSFNRSLLQVGDTFEQNGRQIDKHTRLVADNTEKGIANREAVLAAVRANMQIYQSNIAVGMSAEDAAKAYDEGTKKLEAQLRAAHLTDAQINDLIGTYRDIPDKVNTQIAVEGLTKAISQLDETLRLINGLHDKTVTVYYKTRGQSLNAPLAHGGIRHAATGMIVGPSDPGTLIAEPQTGGEALIPLRGIAPTRAAMLGQIAMSGYGYNVVPQGGAAGGNINVTLHGGDDLTAAMLKNIRVEVRANFGGNVQSALGRSDG